MKADVEKIAISSGERFLGASTAYGYQTSMWLGRLRLHIFWREDPGEAFHDHPWDFWTFPLTSYVELVIDPKSGLTVQNYVPAFRWSFRKAEHAHRILGRWKRYPRAPGTYGYAGEFKRGPIITFCWRGRHRRGWQYLHLNDAGRVRAMPWRRYLELADRGE